ncbi:hypothetical protein [Halostella salina]|nr:hypothetical protein [Halostella salina]
MDDDDSKPELALGDPFLLFNLFQSDVIAAEVDWDDERFVFYPVNTPPSE